MSSGEISLTTAEWAVMECLWEASPLTGREAAERLGRTMDWSRSTTLTLLRRLEAKGAVAGDGGEPKRFSPAIRREDAAVQETEGLLRRVYNGSLSMLVSSLTKKRALPKEEIDELYELLRSLEEEKDD